jgi:pyruvate dehydrogenase E2 component (dihydrolipoamide acetyltransferase)
VSTTTLSDGLFRMPVLGADMTEGRVAEWLVEPGQAVERGQLVAVIETDKSDIEVEVFEPCVFEEFLVHLGDAVPVGEPIARVRPLDGTESATGSTPEPATEPPHELSTPAAGEAPTPVAAVTQKERPPVAASTSRAAPLRPRSDGRRVTPRARRLAAERGVDVGELPSDRVVTGDDVLAAAAKAPTTTPAPNGRRPERQRSTADDTESMRRVIAASMARSWATIPHYHVTGSLDVTDVIGRLERYNADRPLPERVVLGAVLDLAVARAAAETPALNGWFGDGFERAATVDLGVVVSLRSGGIVVPTIAEADQLSLDELMGRLTDLVERVRRGRLRGSDVGRASLTVTSMGDRGADEVHGIIHPPQVALVGLGRPHDEALVNDGEIGVRRIVRMTVAGDHRVSDGLEAARLIDRTAKHLEALPPSPTGKGGSDE